MEHQIKVGLDSRKEEAKMSSVGLTNNGLRGSLLRLMTISSAIRTKAFETDVDQRNVSLEGLTLNRMQILR